MSETHKCLFSLHHKCTVLDKLLEKITDENKRKEIISKWGTEDWIKLNCAMCVKAMYAKAKFKAVSKYSVVNTL